MDLQQLSGPVVVALFLLFFGTSAYIAMRISKKTENADSYMTAGGQIGFGISSASMTATWIWAASMYASATSGFTYGISGPIHYGLWGALMILLIYPFGRRIRQVAPRAHTIAEVMFARHGRSSQLLLAGSNVLGSVISLTANLIAGGALIDMLSPFSFTQGVVAIAGGILLYTLWSGFRASVLTDFVQVVFMLGAVIIIIPVVFFAAGGPELFTEGASKLTAEQRDFFSSEAFFNQGAPYIAAVLAYAIGNQTIAQRLFAVREDLIKKTFVTATFGYGSTIIGVGMLGVIALYAGITPVDNDVNNLIPQMAATYLTPALLCLFFIMIIGSLSSTADADLTALASIVMADVYGQRVGRRNADPAKMVLIGRITMIVAIGAALYFAGSNLNILDLLVFVGALWGALVFPVIASFYWDRVTNVAFSVAVVAALALFIPVRFSWIDMAGGVGIAFDVLATIGIGVVFGLMAFGFLGKRVALIVGAVSIVAAAPWSIGFLHQYEVLSGSLISYSVSTLVCVALTMLNTRRRFDFAEIAVTTGDFDDREIDPLAGSETPVDLDDTGSDTSRDEHAVAAARLEEDPR